MKPTYTTVEFCGMCLRDFRTNQPYPEKCTKCGSTHWREDKKYPTKEGNGREQD